MLPAIHTLADYRPLYRDAANWLPALEAICCRHGLEPASLRQAPPGSNIVFWVEPDCVIKLFAPMWAADADREACALRAMSAETFVNVPHIVAEGQQQGWPYLILTRVPGQPLDAIWPRLTDAEQLDFAASLGRLMARLHCVSTVAVGGLAQDWPAFLQSQAAACLDRQRAAGASPAWLEQAADFLAQQPLANQPDFQSVLLHADLNPEHVFCEYGPAGWQITGMIDFGDAMLGHPYYELVAPGFILGPNPVLRRAMLLGFGFQASDFTHDRSSQLMAYTLLHRFANLPSLLNRFGDHPPDLWADLQSALWGLSVV